MKERKSKNNKDNIEKRLKQAEEMAAIWEESDETVKAYLRGCMLTARALAEDQKAG